MSAVHIQSALRFGVCQEVSQLEPTPLTGYIHMNTSFSSLGQATSDNGHEPNSIHFGNRMWQKIRGQELFVHKACTGG